MPGSSSNPKLVTLPAGRVAATPALVAELIAGQFPQWESLPITPVAESGWDNRSFRLGETMLIRMPTAAWYAAQVAKEQQWLPLLAPALPVPIPQPIAQGVPGLGFPWPWSIYGWLEGAPANLARVPDLRQFATDLAAFLIAMHAAHAVDGPAPGAHSFHRGGGLSVYDHQTRAAIKALGNGIDGAAALRLWEAALASRWAHAAVWVHGDIAPGNLLVRGGRLAAVIDFGSSAVGDPACDLAIGWTFFDAPARAAFHAALGLDDTTITRAAGWALWKALIVLAALPGTNPEGHDAAAAVIAAILNDMAT